MRLREERQKRGLTQDQLARLVGVSTTTISAIECDRTKEPSLSVGMAIAKELRLDPRKLFLDNLEHKPDIPERNTEMDTS